MALKQALGSFLHILDRIIQNVFKIDITLKNL